MQNALEKYLFNAMAICICIDELFKILDETSIETDTSTITDQPSTSHLHNQMLNDESVVNICSFEDEHYASSSASLNSCDDFSRTDDVDMSVNDGEFPMIPVDVQMEWYKSFICWKMFQLTL